jgi:AraC-like DNA-binding protein
MPIKTRFTFRAVDTAPSAIGQISQAAYLVGSAGINQNRPRHFPTRALVLLVHGGGFYRDTQGLKFSVSPGDLLLLTPKVGHIYGPPPGGRWDEFYVCFEGQLFDALESTGVLDPARPVLSLGAPAPWRARLDAAFPPVGRAVSAPNQIGALIAFLLAAHATAPSRAPTRSATTSWLARAQQLLATPGADAPALPAVARACGLRYESFRKQFSLLTGESPARFRRHALIACAQDLMREQSLPDRAIAESLGFCDEFHFSKTFKQATGLSPRAWRSTHPAH